MSEFKNNQNPKRFKKHIHINVSSDSYSFWQKNGFNLSRFVENALNRLRLGITTSNADGIEANPMDLLLICTKNAENNQINAEKEQNNLMPSAELNRRHTDLQYFRLIREMGQILGVFQDMKIFQGLRENRVIFKLLVSFRQLISPLIQPSFLKRWIFVNQSSLW